MAVVSGTVVAVAAVVIVVMIMAGAEFFYPTHSRLKGRRILCS